MDKLIKFQKSKSEWYPKIVEINNPIQWFSVQQTERALKSHLQIKIITGWKNKEAQIIIDIKILVT